jgi:type IV pilus assembly protein PilB
LDELIFQEASKKEMLEHAKASGFRTLVDDAIEKILAGVTDLPEVVDTIDMTERLKDVNIFL